MYTLEEIQAIVAKVIPDLKKKDLKMRYGKPCPQEDIPEYWPGYKHNISMMEDIYVHASPGEFPDKLFKVRAPNQTEAEATYIKANYKQNTLPVFMDYISTMQRPFFDGNWNIMYQKEKWKEQYLNSGNTIQDYVEGEITPIGSLEDYIKFFVVQKKAIDANGVIAVRPKDIKTTEDGRIDNTEPFNPVPYYHSVSAKISFQQNKYYLLETEEKSVVSYGGRSERQGHIFEFYDDQNIWRIVQTGSFTDYEFEYILYFEHKWDRVPVKEMLGVPGEIKGDNVSWISHFYYAVPHLKGALVREQYLNAIEAKVCFPYRVSVGQVCEFEYKDPNGEISKCSSGKVYDSSRQMYLDCTNCNGTGLKDRISALGELRLNPDSDFNKGDATLGQKAFYYVSPETASLEFLRDRTAQDIDAARKILRQQTSNSVVKGTENLTATGMVLDDKAMYSFVKNPSDQTFSIYEFIIDAMGWQRYGADYVKAILIAPQSFDYNTDKDYLNMISEAQKAGLPPFVIHSIIFKYLQTLHYNERQRAEVFTLIINTDRLLTLSQGDILMKFNRGLVQNWEVTLHDSSINLVADLILENEKFFDLDFEAKQDLLINAAKAKTPVQQSAVERVLQASGNQAA